jgi:hypothetical protein
MKLCEHDPYTTITKVKEPRYHDKSILISQETVDNAQEYLLIRFANQKPFEEYGWFVIEKKVAQRQKLQKNGRILVYVISLSKREPFIGVKNCIHNQAALL